MDSVIPYVLSEVPVFGILLLFTGKVLVPGFFYIYY